MVKKKSENAYNKKIISMHSNNDIIYNYNKYKMHGNSSSKKFYNHTE